MFLLIIIIALILILLYHYGKRNHDYWKKRGVKYEKPVIFFGNIIQTFIKKLSISRYYASVYYKYPYEKCVGVFNMSTPALVLRDPEMIKQVLLSDFKYFCYRGIIKKEHKHETLLKSLFFCDGDIWKLMRPQVTPAFSGAKLKAIFPLIVERIDKLWKVADKYANNNVEVNVKELMARYTIEFIGACGFGLNVETLDDENSQFHKVGKRMILATKRDIIVRILRECLPKLTRNLKFYAPCLETFCVSLLRQVMSERNYRHSGRNDFTDMLLEIRQQRIICGESLEKTNPDGSPALVQMEVNDEILTAQMFGFFIAGFETSSMSSSFLLHMLAFHPEEQDRCQREIDDVLNKYDGKICFEAIKDMKYLEMALRESLRILPSVGFLMRQCVEQYTFTGTNLTIDEGTQIIIPLEALHTDEKYFKCPQEFRPSRFTADDIYNRTKFVYMPFGEGPRNCIALRMGMMQSLVGVAAILSKYTVAPSKSSVLVPKISCTSFVIQDIIGGLPLYLQHRRML